MKEKPSVAQTSRTAFSFEVLPPLKGTGIEALYHDVERLAEFCPKYINITTHRSEYVYRELGNGMFQRSRQRRRPCTVAVAAALMARYGITTVPHLLCSGFTAEELEYVLLDLQFLGINEVLVLRGDKAKHHSAFTPEPGGHLHAIDLIHQVNDFNHGRFVDGSEAQPPATPFRYGVACYPEKHEEAPNMEQDMLFLKQKVEAGAQYAVTQLFYDNRKYLDFVSRVRAMGIDIPIIPGIKPLRRKAQLSVLPRTFHVDLPQELVAEVMRCKDDTQVEQLGVEWCIAQCRELMQHGVPGIHFYSMGAVESIRSVAKVIY